MDYAAWSNIQRCIMIERFYQLQISEGCWLEREEVLADACVA